MTLPDLIGALGIYLKSGSLLAYAAAFLGGAMISFTPCVYPVLPITVGYVGGRNRGSRARGFVLSLSCVLGMATTYAALGTAAAVSGKVFGETAASPWANLFIGNVCIAMALSMLDLFHLPIPGVAPGPAPGGKARKGVAGAFLVGMASGLVVGPCTAPVLGALLVYVGTKQNVVFGTSLLFVFALGMGVLPVLAGTFAGFVAGLPKSGKWLVRIKQGFGIFMLLVGEFFLIEAGKLLV